MSKHNSDRSSVEVPGTDALFSNGCVGAAGGVHSVCSVWGIKSVIGLLMRRLKSSSRLDWQRVQTFDFLLTFIKVAGIVSVYISLQSSQTWSLGLFGDGRLLVGAINPISASHIQLTALFTTIKYELRISYGANAVIYEDESRLWRSFQIC